MDLYSFGLVLAEMVSAVRVVRGKADIDVLMEQVASHPHALPPAVLACPIAPVVQRAIAKDPAARFPSAMAMREAVVGPSSGAPAVTAVTGSLDATAPTRGAPYHAAVPAGPPLPVGPAAPVAAPATGRRDLALPIVLGGAGLLLVGALVAVAVVGLDLLEPAAGADGQARPSGEPAAKKGASSGRAKGVLAGVTGAVMKQRIERGGWKILEHETSEIMGCTDDSWKISRPDGTRELHVLLWVCHDDSMTDVVSNAHQDTGGVIYAKKRDQASMLVVMGGEHLKPRAALQQLLQR